MNTENQPIDIDQLLNVFAKRPGHIEVKILPDAVRSLFTGRVVIAPHESITVGSIAKEEMRAPKGLVSLKVCAEYMTAKLGQEFTEKELTEWAESGYLPHVRIKSKGMSCYVGKVMTWVNEQFVRVNSGKPFPFGTHDVYIGKSPPSADIPTALVGIAEKLHVIDIQQVPPCVYFLVRGSEIVYVGQSAGLLSRIGQHGDKKFTRVFYIPVPQRHLNEVEQAFIRAIKPKLNSTHVNGQCSARDLEVIAMFRCDQSQQPSSSTPMDVTHEGVDR